MCGLCRVITWLALCGDRSAVAEDRDEAEWWALGSQLPPSEPKMWLAPPPSRGTLGETQVWEMIFERRHEVAAANFVRFVGALFQHLADAEATAQVSCYVAETLSDSPSLDIMYDQEWYDLWICSHTPLPTITVMPPPERSWHLGPRMTDNERQQINRDQRSCLMRIKLFLAPDHLAPT